MLRPPEGLDAAQHSSPMSSWPSPVRDPAPMLERVLREWGEDSDFWVFGYGSLIWRPDFDAAERLPARVHGWHRALKMWSRINRGSPECPGLVFAMLSGGSCQGVAFRIPKADGHAVLQKLWDREMITGVYDPRWLNCHTAHGRVKGLAFTLSRQSPNYTGELSEEQYRKVFSAACGRYGTTFDYASQTFESLLGHGIEDKSLGRLLSLSDRV
jgi:glutathione-specific gamma-glutamylcyclotransferase